MKYVLLFLTFLSFRFSPMAQTASPIQMHRIQATTKTKDGLYFAKSTDGNFSVLMPIPFNDFTVKDNGVKACTIGSTSSEGIKFSVTEMPKTEKTKAVDLDALMKSFMSPHNTITNVKREKTATYESIYFSIMDKSKGALCKYVVTKNTLFFMIIEFPIAYMKKAENGYSYFFSSLHITKE